LSEIIGLHPIQSSPAYIAALKKTIGNQTAIISKDFCCKRMWKKCG